MEIDDVEIAERKEATTEHLGTPCSIIHCEMVDGGEFVDEVEVA